MKTPLPHDHGPGCRVTNLVDSLLPSSPTMPDHDDDRVARVLLDGIMTQILVNLRQTARDKADRAALEGVPRSIRRMPSGIPSNSTMSDFRIGDTTPPLTNAPNRKVQN